MLHMPSTFQPMNYRTASDRKRLTVKDFSSIIGYCSSAHDWKERRMWIGLFRTCLLLELPVPAAERASWNRTTVSPLRRDAHLQHTQAYALILTILSNTHGCALTLSPVWETIDSICFDFSIGLALNRGPEPAIDLRGEARRNNRGEINVPKWLLLNTLHPNV